MIIKDHKIIECTESELFDYYISRGFDSIYSFIEYKNLLINKGVKIKET